MSVILFASISGAIDATAPSPNVSLGEAALPVSFSDILQSVQPDPTEDAALPSLIETVPGSADGEQLGSDGAALVPSTEELILDAPGKTPATSPELVAQIEGTQEDTQLVTSAGVFETEFSLAVPNQLVETPQPGQAPLPSQPVPFQSVAIKREPGGPIVSDKRTSETAHIVTSSEDDVVDDSTLPDQKIEVVPHFAPRPQTGDPATTDSSVLTEGEFPAEVTPFQAEEQETLTSSSETQHRTPELLPAGGTVVNSDPDAQRPDAGPARPSLQAREGEETVLKEKTVLKEEAVQKEETVLKEASRLKRPVESHKQQVQQSNPASVEGVDVKNASHLPQSSDQPEPVVNTNSSLDAVDDHEQPARLADGTKTGTAGASIRKGTPYNSPDDSKRNNLVSAQSARSATALTETLTDGENPPTQEPPAPLPLSQPARPFDESAHITPDVVPDSTNALVQKATQPERRGQAVPQRIPVLTEPINVRATADVPVDSRRAIDSAAQVDTPLATEVKLDVAVKRPSVETEAVQTLPSQVTKPEFADSRRVSRHDIQQPQDVVKPESSFRPDDSSPSGDNQQENSSSTPEPIRADILATADTPRPSGTPHPLTQLASGQIERHDAEFPVSATADPSIDAPVQRFETREINAVDSRTSVERDQPQMASPRSTQPVVESVLRERLQAEAGQASRVQVRLDPPELGRVIVEVESIENAIRARVTAVDPAAQVTLAEELPALRHALEQAGIENVDIDLGDSRNFLGDDQKDSQSRAEEEARFRSRSQGSASSLSQDNSPSDHVEDSQNHRVDVLA